MAEIAGRDVSFVGAGKRFLDGIKKTFTRPYTDCRLNAIVSFLTANRITVIAGEATSISDQEIASFCFGYRVASELRSQ